MFFQKVGFMAKYRPFVLPLIIFAFGFLFIIMMAEKKVAAVQQSEENKLMRLVNEMYYYFWKDARPVKEPKCNCVLRLWNYFN